MSTKPILCIGEILWDSLPNGLFLGGAPFNVAYHLKSLGADVAMVSCVGDDVLGRIARERIQEKGLSVDLIQIDAAVPTGLVNVKIDPAGNASYEIVAPAAWDNIKMISPLREASESAGAIVFGSLAQRAPISRTTVQQLLSTDALKVFDVNLRPPFDDPEIVRVGLERAQVVKLNDQEFNRLSQWYGFPSGLRDGAAALAQHFGPRIICITRGAQGAVLWNDGRYSEHPGYKVPVRDTVGSGDAFLASLLKGLFEHLPDDILLKCANAHGAFVATKDGATPVLDPDRLRAIESSRDQH
jgi:fructokinase